MNRRLLLILGAIFIVTVLALVLVTSQLTPDVSMPPFAAAVAFVDAAARGDDAAAEAYLSADLRRFVAENCPSGSVSACVDAYIPDEWGAFRGITFRRAAPNGDRWHVDLIGYWERDQGFSGVCVYADMAPESDGQWRVQRWAGFAWCGDPNTRSMATNPDAPNRAP